MNKTGFFRQHHETENTHRDVRLLSGLIIAGAAVLTVLIFGFVLG